MAAKVPSSKRGEDAAVFSLRHQESNEEAKNILQLLQEDITNFGAAARDAGIDIVQGTGATTG